MLPYDSIPYNPDIVNVFYRAGYIENWGQGIRKICDECIALGAELPRYEILGTGIRVYFPALESALIGQPKTPNRQDVGKDVGLEVGLAEKIIELISDNSEIKMSEMAEKLEVTTRTIEREMKKLRESTSMQADGCSLDVLVQTMMGRRQVAASFSPNPAETNIYQCFKSSESTLYLCFSMHPQGS